MPLAVASHWQTLGFVPSQRLPALLNLSFCLFVMVRTTGVPHGVVVGVQKAVPGQKIPGECKW